MPELKRKGPRGLGAIAQNRDDRARGAGRWTAQAGFVAGGAVIAGLVAHKFVSDHELNAGRQTLLREQRLPARVQLVKQRAVVATLGAEWLPLRDNLEGDV